MVVASKLKLGKYTPFAHSSPVYKSATNQAELKLCTSKVFGKGFRSAGVSKHDRQIPGECLFNSPREPHHQAISHEPSSGCVDTCNASPPHIRESSKEKAKDMQDTQDTLMRSIAGPSLAAEPPSATLRDCFCVRASPSASEQPRPKQTLGLTCESHLPLPLVATIMDA